jgi:2-C-methyl-D-erythritol 4-phosphate cytidylyltransferase
VRGAAAIIVAAGQGQRFGGGIRKQYLRLRNRPIVWWSLNAFERCPSFRAIVLVVPKSDVASIRKKASAWKIGKLIAVVPGGATRADSVRHGLQRVPAGCRWVAVHDGVRPLIKAAVIEQVLKAARRYGAAIAACHSKDTVKLAGPSGFVERTPPRTIVWQAQTPQIFNRRLLERVFRWAGFRSATDDAQLVERLGAHVKLVPSPAENVKITVPLDLKLAELFVKREGGRGKR